MDKITLDQTAVNRIGGMDHAVELCDESGRVLGVFRPADGLLDAVAAQSGDVALTEPEHAPDEFTIAQLLDHLHAVYRPEND